MESKDKKRKPFTILDFLKKEPDTLLEKLVDEAEYKYQVGFLHSPNGDKSFYVTTVEPEINTLESLQARHLTTLLEMIRSKCPDDSIVNVRVNDLYYTHSVAFLSDLLRKRLKAETPEPLLEKLVDQAKEYEVKLKRSTNGKYYDVTISTEAEGCFTVKDLSSDILKTFLKAVQEEGSSRTYVEVDLNGYKSNCVVEDIERLLAERHPVEAMQETPPEEVYPEVTLAPAEEVQDDDSADKNEFWEAQFDNLSKYLQDQINVLDRRFTELIEKAFKTMSEKVDRLRAEVDLFERQFDDNVYSANDKIQGLELKLGAVREAVDYLLKQDKEKSTRIKKLDASLSPTLQKIYEELAEAASNSMKS